MSETVEQVEVKAPVGQIEGRPGVTVVTQENFNEFVNEKLGVPENIDPEAAAAEELVAIAEKRAEQKAADAAPKEGDTDGANVYFNGKWVKKHDFNYRLHIKTQEAKAEAQGKIDAAAADAKAAKADRDAIARERDALKAKHEPPKSLEIGPEPKPSDFTEINEYAKALKEWTADSTRKEDAKAQEVERAKKAEADAIVAWEKRQKETAMALPDYAEKVSNSDVKVSDQMREAIIESEVGPRILYHFAEHPEVAEALGKMTVRKMLVEFGKLEASLQKEGDPKATTLTKINTISEISKAPAPISPLRGSHAVDGLKFDAAGNWTGTPEEWKAARLAGKIK